MASERSRSPVVVECAIGIVMAALVLSGDPGWTAMCGDNVAWGEGEGIAAATFILPASGDTPAKDNPALLAAGE